MKYLTQILVALLLAVLAGCGSAGEARPESTSRLAEAEARFAERCKTSGEFIKRTVDNVEGIYLLKLRPEKRNRGDQFTLDDPYGDDLPGVGYIESFVKGSVGESYRKNRRPGDPPRLGYRYVEAVDQQDGKRYRYTGGMKIVGRKDESAPGVQFELKRNPKYDLNIYAFVIDKVPAPGPELRYGVTYDDLSTREDRELWIAGSSLKVIDLKANEVIAERIGYMVDRGQGANGGGRSPWMLAADNACPDFHRFPNPVGRSPGFAGQARQAQDFVEKVLHPISESK